MYIKSDTFLEIATQCGFDAKAILTHIQANLNASYSGTVTSINNRISNYRRKGLLPLDSGNFVSLGEVLKGSSTLFDSNGAIKQQWVKTDVDKSTHLASFADAITSLAQDLPAVPVVSPTTVPTFETDLATLYISNDAHLGALMWGEETGHDWNTSVASQTFRSAYDHLFATTPNSKVGIVVDLGDLTEADNNRNMTPKSGHILATDSRHGKVLRVAYEMLIYAIQSALLKHEHVYFYNISGNHDEFTAIAVREVIRMTFRDNPRVTVCESAMPIKYHQHGSTLLQFAHGDGMKMSKAGEVLAVDCADIFSSTKHRFSHFGHYHVDKVIDSPICRVESHRNLTPNNAWAVQMGYRRNPGTMKAITYHSDRGEISRSTYNI
jgi:hypothetical protein